MAQLIISIAALIAATFVAYHIGWLKGYRDCMDVYFKSQNRDKE